MESQQDVPEVTGSAPLYKRPEPLNNKDHGSLGLLPKGVPYSFAAKQHFVPVVASEFGAAACSYPIVFAGDDKAPIAIMGLNKGENLFLPELANEGAAYVPAYVRRYPFIVANSTSPEITTSIICIDRESDWIGENSPRPFFENGAFSDYTNGCIEFCQNFENDRMSTTDMVQRLKDLDLFEFRNINYQPPGDPAAAPIEIAGFNAISQTKLNNLPVQTYLQLRDQGILTAIMAHWISQANWDRLIAMAMRRASGKELRGEPVAAKA